MIKLFSKLLSSSFVANETELVRDFLTVNT